MIHETDKYGFLWNLDERVDFKLHSKRLKFLQKCHDEKSRDKGPKRPPGRRSSASSWIHRRSLRAWARNVTGPIEKTRVSRRRCDRARKILPEASSTAWRGDQVVKGFRGRTHHYATAFFLPSFLAHDPFMDPGCTRACVCETTWDANVSETRTWVRIITCICATTWKCKYVEGMLAIACITRESHARESIWT